MLALRQEGGQAARQAARGEQGQLVLGANPTCSQYLAPRLVVRFIEDHPQDRVRVTTQLSPGLMEALMDGVTELALCALARADPRAQVQWTYSAPLLLVAAATHPLGRAGQCERADLRGATILSTQAGPTRLGLSKLLPLSVEARVEATAGEALRQLLTRGVGVSVLPAIAVWDELQSGELVRVRVRDAELPDYDIALLSWPERPLSAAAGALIEIANSAALPDLLA
jgi:LysR family hydrogen peroxide-inducible transcriptional activator